MKTLGRRYVVGGSGLLLPVNPVSESGGRNAMAKLEEINRKLMKAIGMSDEVADSIIAIQSENETLRARVGELEPDRNHWRDEYKTLEKAGDILRELLTAKEAELQEEARLNSMGGEREADLLGKVSRLEAELAENRKIFDGIHIALGEAIESDDASLPDFIGGIRKDSKEIERRWLAAETSLANEKQRADILDSACTKALNERDALETSLARAIGYMRHKQECGYILDVRGGYDHPRKCDCGFDQIDPPAPDKPGEKP